MSNISGNQGPQGLDKYNPLYKEGGTSDAPAMRPAMFGSHEVQMAPKGTVSRLLRKMYDSIMYFFGGSQEKIAGSSYGARTSERSDSSASATRFGGDQFEKVLNSDSSLLNKNVSSQKDQNPFENEYVSTAFYLPL